MLLHRRSRRDRHYITYYYYRPQCSITTFWLSYGSFSDWIIFGVNEFLSVVFIFSFSQFKATERHQQVDLGRFS